MEYIQKLIDEIKAEANGSDWESVHILRDELLIHVLREIANGNCYNPDEAAQLALTVEELKLTLWFA